MYDIVWRLDYIEWNTKAVLHHSDVKTLREARGYIDRLPRYHDHPANGDHAGDPFIPGRDPCIVLSLLGEAIDRSPFWLSGNWLCSLVTGYEDGEPTRFETGQFFITYEAAVMFAEETTNDQQ